MKAQRLVAVALWCLLSATGCCSMQRGSMQQCACVDCNGPTHCGPSRFSQCCIGKFFAKCADHFACRSSCCDPCGYSDCYPAPMCLSGDCGASGCGGGYDGASSGCGCSQGAAMPATMPTPVMNNMGTPIPQRTCAKCGGMHAPSGPAPVPATISPMPMPEQHNAPAPSPTFPAAGPAPVPPAETGQVTPQGTTPTNGKPQYVSYEEFQRLPGVIISGPGAAPAATMNPPSTVPQMATATTNNLPSFVPPPAAPPVTAQISTVPGQLMVPPAIIGTPGANPPPAPVRVNNGVQPAGWVPVR